MFRWRLPALSALAVIALYTSTSFFHHDTYRSQSFFENLPHTIPSVKDLRLLSEKPTKSEAYFAREQLISNLNGNSPVSVHVSDPNWWAERMPVTDRLIIDNCPVPCEYSRNEQNGITEEQAVTKDAIMSVNWDNYPEKKPTNATTGEPIFQRWVLFAHEPQFFYDYLGKQEWLESRRVDIFMNFHEDISQVIVSYVDYPDNITSSTNVFNMQEFVQYNKDHPNERRPLISWFSSHVTEYREKWGLGLLNTLGNDFAYFTYSNYRHLSNGIVPEPCRELNMYGVRTCSTAYYPFTLAIENSFEEDYASEKLWSAFESGVVPVVAGAPNTRSFIPAGSAIFIEDFASPEELSKYLLEVSQDVDKYEKYSAWRRLPQEQWPDGFRYKMKMSRANMQCNLCVELARQRYLKRPEIAKALREINL
ncbi:hypothetical protein BGZ92_009179 [Podila epicladia]|nr:hypothetical protein BGZ92_009179 [Podila epicladia]